MQEALILAALLSALHVLSEWFDDHVHRLHSQIVSLNAGVFITFMFIVLLPQLAIGEFYLGENIYAFALVGFVLYHVGERYLYQHITHRKDLMRSLAHAHVAGFFADGIIIGMSVVLFFDVYSAFTARILFLPLVIHTVASTISSKHIHEHFRSGIAERALLSSAPLLGALFATFLGLYEHQFYFLFALIVGMLFYVVIRGVLPQDRKGKPLWFLVGAVMSLLLLRIEHIGF
ncbi:hypothetical protein DRN67_04280 [Candidatus Micrarchaeota archaeon]|nr:MAG: hypothetical protein DRN67_04280 [Candidatus Micrarchaeota archaeon]